MKSILEHGGKGRVFLNQRMSEIRQELRFFIPSFFQWLFQLDLGADFFSPSSTGCVYCKVNYKAFY